MESEGTSLSKVREANWPAVLFFIHIHLLSFYGIWLVIFEAKWMTLLLLVVLSLVAVLGVTAGAHRLWAHGAYKASTGLRIALMIFQTLAGQGTIYDWVQYHRLHHATFATDADPFDYRRGFGYAHVIARLRKLSPLQEKLKSEIDMSDLDNDPVVVFQSKAYWIMYGILFVLLPLNAPLEYWNDSILSAVFVIGFVRYLVILHASWLVESGICVWGLQPGEKCPPDSNWLFILTKTFWPHYHYMMPYDYKSDEYGTYDSGCTTAFIRVWAALNLATDLKTIDTPVLQKALAEAAKSKRPIQTCLDEAVSKQSLPAGHYLQRG
ncbi:acyl-CoA Delta-9 desaturase [Ostrinia nubilalis]|uniref:acyl-CoA Delta-9 desaturase n=1 Tax=Ostrinia nubilalis TaxID=29057 RepID=UPI0030825FEB